jgi:ankyrin repeat protein
MSTKEATQPKFLRYLRYPANRLIGVFVVCLLLWVVAPKPNSQANRNLLQASWQGDAPLVRKALAEGANPNCRILHTPSVQQTAEKAMLFVQRYQFWNPHSAYLARKRYSYQNETALFSAVRLGYPEAVQTLLEAGADPNIGSRFQESPLIRTVYLSSSTPRQEVQLALAKLLLEHGANPNASDIDGRTPLIVAITSHAPVEMVKLLLEAGANPRQTMRNGAGVFDFLGKGTHPAVTALLQPYRAPSP